MSYEINWERNGVIKNFTGTIDDEEFIAATEEVQGHSDFGSLLFVINDLSELTRFNVSAQVIESYFASVSAAYPSNPNIKVAFVTKNPGIENRINEFVRTSPLPYRLRVFDSLNGARHWCKAHKR